MLRVFLLVCVLVLLGIAGCATELPPLLPISVDNADQVRELASLTGHTRGVLSVAFSPDGALLASGSTDDTVRLWDVETRQELAAFTEHTSGVSSVAFSPDGTLLASGSVDNTVRLWGVPAE